MKPKTFPPRRLPKISEDTPFIMDVPVISSAHFSQSDIDELYNRDFVLAVSDDGDSTFITIEDYLDYNLSPEGAAVLKHFVELGYLYLRISGEVGDLVAGFPTFPEPEPCPLNPVP